MPSTEPPARVPSALVTTIYFISAMKNQGLLFYLFFMLLRMRTLKRMRSSLFFVTKQTRAKALLLEIIN